MSTTAQTSNVRQQTTAWTILELLNFRGPEWFPVSTFLCISLPPYVLFLPTLFVINSHETEQSSPGTAAQQKGQLQYQQGLCLPSGSYLNKKKKAHKIQSGIRSQMHRINNFLGLCVSMSQQSPFHSSSQWAQEQPQAEPKEVTSPLGAANTTLSPLQLPQGKDSNHCRWLQCALPVHCELIWLSVIKD